MSLKLKVGEFYLNASGEIIKINGSNKSLNTFLDTSDNEYEINGICVGDMRIFDLIAHIPKELHYNICNMINDYHTNKTAIKSMNNQFNNQIIKEEDNCLNCKDNYWCATYQEYKNIIKCKHWIKGN